MVRTLHHGDVLGTTAKARLIRATLTSMRPKTLHDHDFHEVFWVQNGTVRHHLPDCTMKLQEGDLILLSPGQRHALQGKGEAALVVSTAFHPALVADLVRRHPEIWPAAHRPFQIQLDMRQLTAFNQAALSFEASANSVIAAEAFLLFILSNVERATVAPHLPDWLAKAMRAARRPEVFSQGAAGFVAQTDRAHAHVSRAMRKLTGDSPSEYINRLRMTFAARALTSDSEPVADIAQACGVPNMAHFHKLFRAHHGMTPLQYRQQFQRDVVQPR